MEPLTRLGRSGQTLIETLVFVIAAMIVSGAVIAVATEAFRGQVIELRAEGPRAGAQLAAHAITQALFSATALVSPAPGASGGRLEGYIGRTLLVSGAAPTWVSTQTGDGTGSYTRFLFCVDSSNHLYYYLDTTAAASSDPPNITCGASGGQILTGAGLVSGRLSGAPFSRPAQVVNFVEVAFDVKDPNGRADPEPVDLELSLQGGVVPP